MRPGAPGTRAGGSAAARPPRPHKSASPTQGHVRMALAAAAARPLAAASTTAPAPWLWGRRAAFPRGTVRPPAAPRPSSRPALPSHLPRACPSGLCCWLLLLAAGCWLLLAPTTSGWGEPVAQPHHIRRLSSTHGARLGPWTFSGPERPVVGARPPPSPTSPPAPPPPQPSPHPRFGPTVTQPLSGSHPV